MRTLMLRLNNMLRLARLRELFRAIDQYCKGEILDVGGFDFFQEIAKRPKVNFSSWTSLELEKNSISFSDARYKSFVGDGENMQFPSGSFDTILNIQVLEHTFNPTKMLSEIERVLKPGGYGIFVIPQSSLMHAPPVHYYNFTKFWIAKAMKVAGLEIVELKALGGFWSTMASNFVLFFYKAFKSPYYSTIEDKRGLLFYFLLPIMAAYALISIPVCLFLSLSDLIEDP